MQTNKKIRIPRHARTKRQWSSEETALTTRINTSTTQHQTSTQSGKVMRSSGRSGAVMAVISREEALASADALRPVDGERAGEPDGARFALGDLNLMLTSWGT